MRIRRIGPTATVCFNFGTAVHVFGCFGRWSRWRKGENYTSERRHFESFRKKPPPAVKFPSFYWLSLGENRVVHHFTGSTLEAKIQNIILLKHHFTGSFLKKIACGAHHFTGASFYRGKVVKYFSQNPSFYWNIILPGTYCTTN